MPLHPLKTRSFIQAAIVVHIFNKWCFAVFFAITFSACQAQETLTEAHLLLEEQYFDPLVDEVNHPAMVEEVDGVLQWRPGFAYADSLQVSKLTYSSDGLRVKAWLVQPKRPGKYPCIIYNRGGVQEFGATRLPQAVGIIGRIAKAGYVVIASQYRGNDGGEGQEEYGGAEINDVLNLIPLLSEIPNADTSRIGMFGGSRGGLMTYQAITQTNRIKAAVVLAGVADKAAGIIDRPNLEQNLIDLVPNYQQNKQAELTKRSPVQWVDRFPTNVPLLIMHGSSDWRVKATQSLQLAMELEKYRIPYRLIIYEGDDHGLSGHRQQFFTQTISWFDRYVRNGEVLPNMEFHGR